MANGHALDWKSLSLLGLLPITLALAGAVWSYHSGAFMQDDFHEYKIREAQENSQYERELDMLRARVNSLDVEIGKIGRDVTYIREAIDRLESARFGGWMHNGPSGDPGRPSP